MACYCANYYGSINCHNTVSRFGDRCKLCLALRSGASLSNGLLLPFLLPEDEREKLGGGGGGGGGIVVTTASADHPRRHHFRSGPEARGRVSIMEGMMKR